MGIQSPQVVEADWGVDVAISGAASVVDFFFPNFMHPLWRDWIRDHLRRPNATWIGMTSLGIIPFVLAVYAWREKEMRSRLIPYAITGIASVFLAMGPFLQFNGCPVVVPIPLRLEKAYLSFVEFLVRRLPVAREGLGDLSADGTVGIPLPALGLYFVLPFFKAMRDLTRFGYITNLMVAILTGIGFKRLRDRANSIKHGLWVGGPILVALLFELAIAPLGSITGVQPRAVDSWLAEQQGEWAIVEFPLSFAEKGKNMYYSLTHSKRWVSGQATFPPPEYIRNRPLLNDFPSQASLDLLCRLNVRYVLVDLLWWQDPGLQEEVEQQDELQLVAQFDGTNEYC